MSFQERWAHISRNETRGKVCKNCDGMWNILDILKKISNKAGGQAEARKHTHSLRTVLLGLKVIFLNAHCGIRTSDLEYFLAPISYLVK